MQNMNICLLRYITIRKEYVIAKLTRAIGIELFHVFDSVLPNPGPT